MRLLRTLTFTPQNLILDGEEFLPSLPRPLSPTAVYRAICNDYPKFFKMDAMSRLAFLSAELILNHLPPEQKESLSIIMFNSEGSLATDRLHQATIGITSEECLASPATFVYTLPNIAAGEVAIRHKIYGSTNFFVVENLDSPMIDKLVEATCNELKKPDYYSSPSPQQPLSEGGLDVVVMKFYSVDPGNFKVNCYLY